MPTLETEKEEISNKNHKYGAIVMHRLQNRWHTHTLKREHRTASLIDCMCNHSSVWGHVECNDSLRAPGADLRINHVTLRHHDDNQLWTVRAQL